MVRAGLEVVLLDHRPDRAEHIHRRGLLLEDGPEQIRVPAAVTLEPLDLSGVDLVLICVKAYDTEEVARRLTALDPPPYFLTLQNGVGNVELLGAHLLQERVLAGITSHGATDLGPGWVRHAGRGDTFVGSGFAEETENQGPGVQLARQALSLAGFETRTVPRIQPLIWSKLLINVGINALTALTRLPNGDLLKLPGTEKTLEEAVDEAQRVARAKGIDLIYADPLGQVKKRVPVHRRQPFLHAAGCAERKTDRDRLYQRRHPAGGRKAAAPGAGQCPADPVGPIPGTVVPLAGQPGVNPLGPGRGGSEAGKRNH